MFKEERCNEEFYIADMLEIVEGNIADKEELDKHGIDTVVNAANPTLMGSEQGVDGAIHSTIDKMLPGQETFRRKICEELNVSTDERVMRCKRGDAVLTSGYGLCSHIIHVVGVEYDGAGKKPCSSSRVHILEQCYYNIIAQVRKRTDIRKIAVPIIGAGAYGFPLEEAAKIAIASIGNALIEWCEQEPELFRMSGIQCVCFFTYEQNVQQQNNGYHLLKKVLKKYTPAFERNRKVVFQSSLKAHARYFAEVARYDGLRGYFSVAKGIRQLLLLVRALFIPMLLLKDLFGGIDWRRRRQFVEIITVIKAAMPVLLWWMAENIPFFAQPVIREIIFPCIILYNLCDTVTYLLTLIIMADIQRPSANVIRSLIMLVVNYLEVSFELAFLYFQCHQGKILFREAIAFGIIGKMEIVPMVHWRDYIFMYASAGLRFFFVSLVFGYFANHLRQRKFRS